MEILPLLEKMEETEASDLYLSTGAPPSLRVHGKIFAINDAPLPRGEIKHLAYSILNQKQVEIFEKNLELNMAYMLSENRRFRFNLFIQKNEVGMVIRRINTIIPSPEQLGLPPVLKELIMEKRGLILFVGATGCGKSTTMASLIDCRNQASADHIVTIEDPIEFVHFHKRSIIDQREVGLDTLSYKTALKNTLRQAPDVILIGEIRSTHTMEQVLSFCETGHLCITTLHASDTIQAFDRIINFFPEEKRAQTLLDLAFNTKAIISQRLITNLEGKRSLAIEVLLGTPLVLALIQRGDFQEIKGVMEKSVNLGMQTFDQSLELLYKEKKISLEEALRNADSKNNLRLKINLEEKLQQGAEKEKKEGPDSLKLVDD